ncbi:hypothetical protein HGRIS_008488 [Hohenbuehelia grisea]|uniref:SMP-LTD domain-containing protein n=1 Tax=Hohenbuehelia grisea TaxID=104357 RepID=A0ABR3J8C5_9AGAR
MSFKALVYAYVLGGLTFIPLVVLGLVFFTIYTSVPVGDPDPSKDAKSELQEKPVVEQESDSESAANDASAAGTPSEVNDIPRTRKGWLTMRRTFEESTFDGSYVTLVRSFLDARSKDPKRSRPKDMWYVVLKGKVLYLYEDEGMTECEAAIELSGHEVIIYPEGQLDGELFAKRNAICLRPKVPPPDKAMPSVTKEMKLGSTDVEGEVEAAGGSPKNKEKERERLVAAEKRRDEARQEALDVNTPWFIFVRSNVEMEDWYFSLIHASEQPAHSPMLAPLFAIFQPTDMNHLVATLDEQPDVIPMRWLNALIGRIFFSYYRTRALEANIIGRLMKKLSKVKRPNFLTDVVVKEVSVGNRAPTLSKPMLKELTKEGDAALEVHVSYKGEIRITVEATAVINIGTFRSYTVKIVLAAVLKELEGNLLIKVKRPPSNRIWYAFTQTPRMVLEVEPIVSDRQITWTMILGTIESRLKEIIQESVVMPNMDDIAFFESSAFSHRGGIWGDAARPEVLGEAPTESPDPEDAPATDASTAASALPSLEKSNSLPPSIAVTESAPLPRVQTAEEVCSSGTTGSPPEVSSVRSMPTNLPSSEEATDSTANAISNPNRRSWFSGLRNEEQLSTETLQDMSDPSIDDEDRRGRSEVPKVTSISSQAQRSHSTPNARPEDERSIHESEPAGHTLQRQLSTASSAHRPSSRPPSTHEHASSIASDDSHNESYSDGSAITRSSSRNIDGAQRAATPASPTGFLSTLKARAQDKQALSNTAKEAMRKWSVNWSGFRRDASNGSSGSGHKPGGSLSGTEDLPDHGSLGGQHGEREASGSSSNKARPTYAEVRAAVTERREREREKAGPFSSDRPEEDDQPKKATNSIAIPDAGKVRARVVSAGAALAPQRSNTSSSSPISTSPSISTSWSADNPQRLERPVTPQRLDSKVSDSSQTTKDKPAKPADDVEEKKPAVPIHRQPQGKTMAIPGIHASHRGDVMSMGYVAPTQPPPSPSVSDARSESTTGLGHVGSGVMVDKLKQNPAVQSVYRFWKSPVGMNMSGGTPPPTQSPAAPSQVSAPAQAEASVSSTTAEASGSSATRRTPPPLPPRTLPTPQTPARTQSSSSATATAVSGSPESARSVSGSPSASEALKSIAVKDENMRVKRASLALERDDDERGSRDVPREDGADERNDFDDRDDQDPFADPRGDAPSVPVDTSSGSAQANEGQDVDLPGLPSPAVLTSPTTPRTPNPGPPLPPRRVPAASA